MNGLKSRFLPKSATAQLIVLVILALYVIGWVYYKDYRRVHSARNAAPTVVLQISDKAVTVEFVVAKNSDKAPEPLTRDGIRYYTGFKASEGEQLLPKLYHIYATEWAPGPVRRADGRYVVHAMELEKPVAPGVFWAMTD